MSDGPYIWTDELGRRHPIPPGPLRVSSAPFDDHEAHLRVHREFLRDLERRASYREQRRRASWWRRCLLRVVDWRLP